MPVETTREIVFDRISPEIHFAKQSASIWQCIGEHSSKLNGSSYQDAFGIIQRQALFSLVLSIGTLFEQPCEKYPNCSIPTVIEKLKVEIQTIRVNTASLGKLVDNYTDEPDEQLHLLCNKEEIPQILLTDFEEQCPRLPARQGSALDDSFNRIKVIRDKRVAHLENVDISTLPKADWDSVKQLLAFAETFVNLIGYGLFGFSLRGRVRAEDIALRDQPSGDQLRRVIETLAL